ncbi:MAG: hypothetical protein J07HQW2_00042 [Haloquadratum walsbyi J07HQW2]|uniref:Uncharacterized protein n=1 Tax=Haloquadratum walsbyi J07HQW2 TaxID=1238425 RepID=U1MTK3_9EURY|nr:MAG: hypothetical protein J07HQW2_00042 [Haloquadratum walsbyi J07HQW2]
MRAHARRFGMTDLEENVVHFPVPDVLPGFSFFDLEPSMESGRRREDAVQRKTDHYEEILKLVMGTDRYERATGPRLSLRHSSRHSSRHCSTRNTGVRMGSTERRRTTSPTDSSNTSSTSSGRPGHRTRTSATPHGRAMRRSRGRFDGSSS